ncbi:SDR family oxidoreductase [Arenicella xantha]|uniref:NADP-dependent 3-hydroxy acid dehydrogenase YdfG n=1 Tax=Arenicella xantha TaxID=644221 RepID=A0A395JHE4_9GAMM|nr:SDR family oxidoreductase [Arenicella xantha]RBP48279.1 NADP-dependent 3-hydroxy acid dehydrogenase YdfG [Arenicella xantha]
MSQNNKSALITGASSGIGLATAKQLLAAGYSVSGIARDFSDVETIGMDTHSFDLSKLDALPSFLKQANLPADVLILNAGYGQFGGIEQFSHAQIRKMVDTNLVSHFYLLKHYLPIFKQRGHGDIVLIGSESALQGARAGAVYCATKFALRGLAQSLRADCSTSNIRVMLVNPGPVDSDFFDQLDFAPQLGNEFVIEPESVAQAILHTLAQPRNVVVDEINLQPIKRSFRKK